MNVEDIARVCHEANRALQAVQERDGIPVSPPWEEVDEHTRESAELGVLNIMGGDISPEQSHANWCAFKREDGWVFGEVKDAELKTHPLLVEWEELEEEDRVKDELFGAIVRTLAGSV